jgi:hypothetical protein
MYTPEWLRCFDGSTQIPSVPAVDLPGAVTLSCRIRVLDDRPRFLFGGETVVRNDVMRLNRLRDYLRFNHPDEEEDHGRTPLLMSTHGKRCEPSTIQRNVYTMTRPCHYTGECPMDRDIDECEATSYNTASKCPASISPHALRRGYVTEALNAGQPKEVTADRVDMTNDILEKHYDNATKNEQMERREDHLKEV